MPFFICHVVLMARIILYSGIAERMLHKIFVQLLIPITRMKIEVVMLFSMKKGIRFITG